MKPNLEQTFSTPANSKNKVYFMWDSTLRTFQHLVAEVSPQDPHHSSMITEVVGRAAMAKQLIVDETGKLETGNASLGYKDDEDVDFGDGIKAVARQLDELDKGCYGCGKTERDDGKPLLLCARCKDQKYCSTQCQKRCWKMHKQSCAT